MKTPGITQSCILLIVLLSVGCRGNQNIPAPTATMPPPLKATETLPPEPTTTPTDTPSPEPTDLPTVNPTEKFISIPYSDKFTSRRRVDIYVPGDQQGPYPTILAIKSSLHTRSYMATQAEYFAQRGYATVVIGYREIPDYPYPADIEDATCALAWAHTNALTYNLDIDNFFIMGNLLGGTLAGRIGTIDDPNENLINCPYALPKKDWVRGSMMVCGYFDMTHASMIDAPVTEYYFRSPYAEIPEVWKYSSPSAWADSDDPPLLWVCGDEIDGTDVLGPWVDILVKLHADIEKRITDTGIDATVTFVPGLYMSSFENENVYAAMEEFIIKYQQ